MSAPFTFSDIEMYADREDDLKAMLLELACDEVDDELPAIIQDNGFSLREQEGAA
jgi:hypothetical protein